MNIDKFGHHVHKRLRLDQILGLHSNVSDGALVKSSTGEFNLKSSTLKGLKSPVAPDEAVNKAYVDTLSRKFVSKEEIKTELKNIRAELYDYTKLNILNLYKHLQEEQSKQSNEQTANSKRNS